MRPSPPLYRKSFPRDEIYLFSPHFFFSSDLANFWIRMTLPPSACVEFTEYDIFLYSVPKFLLEARIPLDFLEETAAFSH